MFGGLVLGGLRVGGGDWRIEGWGRVFGRVKG